MSKTTYFPDRGDLIEMNFHPAAGREIDKRRPAIVISSKIYNRSSGLCLSVPITSDLNEGPFWIPLPAGLLPRPGLILCDKINSHDFRERSAAFLSKVSEELVESILMTLLDLLDPAM